MDDKKKTAQTTFKVLSLFADLDGAHPDIKGTSGDHLREWRRHFGFTQKEMAQLLGISTRMYRYYEAGERENGRKVEIPTMLWLALAYLRERAMAAIEHHLSSESDGKT